jgi:hypothetical protein
VCSCIAQCNVGVADRYLDHAIFVPARFALLHITVRADRISSVLQPTEDSLLLRTNFGLEVAEMCSLVSVGWKLPAFLGHSLPPLSGSDNDIGQFNQYTRLRVREDFIRSKAVKLQTSNPHFLTKHSQESRNLGPWSKQLRRILWKSINYVFECNPPWTCNLL